MAYGTSLEDIVSLMGRWHISDIYAHAAYIRMTANDLPTMAETLALPGPEWHAADWVSYALSSDISMQEAYTARRDRFTRYDALITVLMELMARAHENDCIMLDAAYVEALDASQVFVSGLAWSRIKSIIHPLTGCPIAIERTSSGAMLNMAGCN